MTIKANNEWWREWILQLFFYALVFFFYSFDKDRPQIQFHQFVFFANYALAALLVSYVLLPRFFYKKKYIAFFIAFAVVITVVILIEELVLEKIYFPDTRGQRFPGVIYSLLDVLPIILILSGFKFAWDALRKQGEVETLQAAVRESELQFLKSQINPHFLFNNLNNLYSYAIEQSPKTPDIILELAGVLRYMLYECKEEYVPLTKEVAQLQNFIRLSELQIEERGQVIFNRRNIEAGYQIAPLILIVFIENAFKHSTASQADNIRIEVTVEMREPGVLYFKCKNSFQPQANHEKVAHGIGLANVRKRLELLYPKAHQLQIEVKENWYEVDLKLHLSV